MKNLQCFKALGLHETPETRETVEAAYEAKKREIRGGTESERLALRLLEENCRACLRLMETEEGEGA